MPLKIDTEAIVLQRSELGESDRLVTLLTCDRGILRAVAPGARRSRRRFGGCLELFARVGISAVHRRGGGGGLLRLEEAVLRDSHEPLKTDLICIAHAGYLAELILAFWGEQDQAADAYRLLDESLLALDRGGPLPSAELRRFELRVLDLAGLAPRLRSCIGCGALDSRRWNFDHDRGGILCCGCPPGPRAEPLAPAALRLLRLLQHDGEIRPGAFAPKTMHAARSLLGRMIGDHAGRPLKARDFLRRLAQPVNKPAPQEPGSCGS